VKENTVTELNRTERSGLYQKPPWGGVCLIPQEPEPRSRLSASIFRLLIPAPPRCSNEYCPSNGPETGQNLDGYDVSCTWLETASPRLQLMHCAAVVIGRITGPARPPVCLSVPVRTDS